MPCKNIIMIEIFPEETFINVLDIHNHIHFSNYTRTCCLLDVGIAYDLTSTIGPKWNLATNSTFIKSMYND
jgi:hypothetical protein